MNVYNERTWAWVTFLVEEGGGRAREVVWEGAWELPQHGFVPLKMTHALVPGEADGPLCETGLALVQ